MGDKRHNNEKKNKKKNESGGEWCVLFFSVLKGAVLVKKDEATLSFPTALAPREALSKSCVVFFIR